MMGSMMMRVDGVAGWEMRMMKVVRLMEMMVRLLVVVLTGRAIEQLRRYVTTE